MSGFNGTGTNQTFVIRNYKTSKYIELKSSLTFSATATNYFSQSARFYVKAVGVMTYTFQPASQPKKYLAVSGTNIVLKSSSDVSDDSHKFREMKDNGNNDYVKYESTSNPNMYITADSQGNLSLVQDGSSSPKSNLFKRINAPTKNDNDSYAMPMNTELVRPPFAFGLERMISVEE